MNESDIPREWWHDQDQDDAWIKEQEDSFRQHEEESDNPLLADGFEDALIGFGQQFNQKIAIYDYARCVEVLAAQGFSYEDAIEWMEYNVVGAYVGRRTPIFLTERVKKKKKQITEQLSFDFGGAR